MGTPHKHAALIKAWADGAEIEFCDEFTKKWAVIDDPSWAPGCTYRIKKEVVNTEEYRRYIAKRSEGEYIVSLCINTTWATSPCRVEASKSFVKWIDHDWVSHTVDLD